MSRNNPGGQTLIQVTSLDANGLAEINRAFRYFYQSLSAMNNGPLGALKAALDFGGFKGINLADPSVNTDAVNKEYADANYGATAVRKAFLTLQQGSNPLVPIAGSSGSGIPIPGTHAQRISTTYQASSFTAGQLFYETDRTTFYVVQLVTGVLTWTWGSGIYSAVIASQPGDLGTTDTGFRFTATDTAQHFRWTGSKFVEEYEIDDAGTNDDPAILNLIHRTSNTPAAGFGANLAYLLDSSTKVQRLAGYLALIWSAATNGSESADFVVGLRSAGTAAAEAFRIRGTTSAVSMNGKVAVYNALAPIAGQLLIGNTTAGTFDAAFLTQGAGITITNADGAITIALTAAFPIIEDTVNLTVQTAAITSTPFANSSTPGQYQVSYNLVTTTSAALTGSIQLTVAYTDDSGARQQKSSAVVLTTAGGTSGVFSVQTFTGFIAYGVSLTGSILTAQYSFHATLMRLA